MTSFARPISLALGTALATVACTMGAPAAKAFCTSGALASGNDCTTFNSSTASTATLQFTDSGLSGDRYFQLLPYLSAGAPAPASYSVSGFQWSTNNTSYTNFYPSGFTVTTAGVGSTPAFVDMGSQLASNLLYIRYTLPAGVPANTTFNFALVSSASNSTGTVTAIGPYSTGILNSSPVIASRTNSTSAPAPLPMLGAAVAMAHASRLRRRIRQQHQP